MKVQIERHIVAPKYMASANHSTFQEFNEIVKILLKSKNVDDAMTNLRNFDKMYFLTHFEFGRGSSHVWVSNLTDNQRVLLAVEDGK